MIDWGSGDWGGRVQANGLWAGSLGGRSSGGLQGWLASRLERPPGGSAESWCVELQTASGIGRSVNGASEPEANDRQVVLPTLCQ